MAFKVFARNGSEKKKRNAMTDSRPEYTLNIQHLMIALTLFVGFEIE